MKRLLRIAVLRFIIKIIKKYFNEGLQPIWSNKSRYGEHDYIIAWKWSWSVDIENETKGEEN